MSLHVIATLHRRPDLTHEQFIDYWANHHLVNTGAVNLTSLPYAYYHQNHGIRDGALAEAYTASYDGVTDMHIRDYDAWRAMLSSPRVTEVSLADEKNFLDGGPQWYIAEDEVVLEGDPVPDGFKLFRLQRRRPGLRFREFRQELAARRGAAAPDQPGVLRWVQANVVDEAYLWCQPRYDIVEIVWVDAATDLGDLVRSLDGGITDLVAAAPETVVTREVVPEFLRQIVAESDRLAAATW